MQINNVFNASAKLLTIANFTIMYSKKDLKKVSLFNKTNFVGDFSFIMQAKKYIILQLVNN